MGRGVWMNGGRIRIEGKWWRWDEKEEVLKDEGWEEGGKRNGGKSGGKEVRGREQQRIEGEG